jgi:hypothetical protein
MLVCSGVAVCVGAAGDSVASTEADPALCDRVVVSVGCSGDSAACTAAVPDSTPKRATVIYAFVVVVAFAAVVVL